jgi:hypothetical protein
VVVAVGLTLVEPLADADVNVPGVIAILVAPVAAQLNVLLAPEFTLVGFAVKEVIPGDPFPEGELDELVPQPSAPTQTARIRIRDQIFGTEELSIHRDGLWLCGRIASKTQSIARAVVAVVIGGRSPLGQVRQFINRGRQVIGRSTMSPAGNQAQSAFRKSTRPAATSTLVSAAYLGQQSQDFKVQPNQSDHQREAAVPFHILWRSGTGSIFDEIEIQH